MSKICDICQKGAQKGNLVPRGIGRRVTKRTITVRQPNLRSKRVAINGQYIRIQMCASCLKRLKFEENQIVAANAAANVAKSA